MRFTVVWSPSASQDLADIWIRAGDRNAVARAADALDNALARDPSIQGESRQPGVRVTFAEPLGINFEVNHADRQVRVLAVWRIDRR
jgi:plasmid stabilization system protein ParE